MLMLAACFALDGAYLPIASLGCAEPSGGPRLASGNDAVISCLPPPQASPGQLTFLWSGGYRKPPYSSMSIPLASMPVVAIVEIGNYGNREID